MDQDDSDNSESNTNIRVTTDGYNGYRSKPTTPSSFINNLNTLKIYTPRPTTTPFSPRRPESTIRTTNDGFSGYIDRVSLGPIDLDSGSTTERSASKEFGASLLEELVGGKKSSNNQKRKYEESLSSSITTVATKGEPTFINIGSFNAATSKTSSLASTGVYTPVSSTSAAYIGISSTRLIGAYTPIIINDIDESNDNEQRPSGNFRLFFLN